MKGLFYGFVRPNNRLSDSGKGSPAFFACKYIVLLFTEIYVILREIPMQSYLCN